MSLLRAWLAGLPAYLWSGWGAIASLFLLLAVVANIFLQMSALSLALSAMFMLFSSGAILLTTQQIVRGCDTNYISATVTLYVSIYNIFLSLLSLLGGNRN